MVEVNPPLIIWLSAVPIALARWLDVGAQFVAMPARVWSRYRPIAAFNGLTVYRRGKGGCLDTWVATEPKAEVRVR